MIWVFIFHNSVLKTIIKLYHKFSLKQTAKIAGVSRRSLFLYSAHMEFPRKLGVEALYLFGSRAQNRAGPLSDYDFGVLLNDKIPAKNFLDSKLEIMAQLRQQYETNKVDVVILNEAPPLLAMNIISDGKLLFEDDHEARVDFETRTTMKYLDRLYYERKNLEHLTKNV
ncbi:hypothetical protein COV82_02640 [Candidatus Peregrinibacteria bacterium CG11_big_fil_rev_8_21_14_0_20_46_8]|nr:MAG: hypothetical protein COV82_02640 [Candidatus Peregrinibacteria bacterium CG11_big_fil_rev_8_21_14_0_20_46_8]